jgi:hypothetical protein
MALSDYKTIPKTNLKVHKKHINKFMADFFIEGIRKRETFTLDLRDTWTPKHYIESAKLYYMERRQVKKESIGLSTIDPSSKLQFVYEMWNRTLDHSKGWTATKHSFYQRYLEEPLGGKQIDSIQEQHIWTIIRKMQSEGMATRTVNTTLEILRPFFDFCIKNKAIRDNPTRFIVLKKDNVKKIVTNGAEMFKRIFEGITNYYGTQPFYLFTRMHLATGAHKHLASREGKKYS